MSTQIFVNLPVKDLEKSKKFFKKLGYTFNPQFTDKNAACLVISDEIYVMLLVKKFFKSFLRKRELVNAKKSTEAILALSAESKKEVDALLKKAIAAGGKIHRPTEEQGSMYGRSFEDLDGHIWEVFWMDLSQLKQAEKKIPERVIHFEIHAVNHEKIAKFYTDVFDWKFEEWKMGTDIPEENRYWAVLTAPIDSKEPGINGGMLIRRGALPTGNEAGSAYICTVNVKNVDESVEKVIAAGGMVTVPKMAIPEMAWLAYCKDPEGNTFGVFQSDTNAK